VRQGPLDVAGRAAARSPVGGSAADGMATACRWPFVLWVSRHGSISAMTEAEQVPHRDDRAWPRGAGPISLVVGLAAIAFGVAVTASSAQALISALCLLAGLLIGSSLIVVGMQRWLSGKGIPAGLGMTSVAVAVAAWVFFTVTGMTGGGGALFAGLVGGLLLANVWAIQAARANRRR